MGMIKSRWFLVCTLLVEKMVQVFWTDYKVNLSESKAIPHYFRHSIESFSLWSDYMLTMFVRKVLSGWFRTYRSFEASVILPIACKLFESIKTIRAIVRKPHGFICGKPNFVVQFFFRSMPSFVILLCFVETLARENKEKDDKLNKLKQVAIKAKKELENYKKQVWISAQFYFTFAF